MKRQHLYLSGVLLAVTAGLPGSLAAFAQEIKDTVAAGHIQLQGVCADRHNAGVPEQNTGC